MKRIVVLGSTNTDMVISGKKIPVPGETVSGGKFLMNPGGKGANQAVAVARLAAKKGACTFIAKVGDDLFGRETAVRMKKDGIDAKLIVDRKEPSGTALILVDQKGQNVISVALGANGTLSPADADAYAAEIEGAVLAHGDLTAPAEFNYIDSEDAAAANFAATDASLVFVGHTHMPGIYLTGQSGYLFSKLFINDDFHIIPSTLSVVIFFIHMN